MARVDMDFNLYKKLKEEHEMHLLKVYDKTHKSHYKQNELWERVNEAVKHIVVVKDELESEIRTKHKL